MARLIYADKIVNGISLYMTENAYLNDTPLDALKMVANWITDAQTVDAVEVVRCRDCKYSTPPSLVTQKYGVPGALTCHNHNSPCNKRNVKGECFCPYGDRKDGDGNG